MIDLEQPQLIAELADWIVGMLVQQQPWEWATAEFKPSGTGFDTQLEVLDAGGHRVYGTLINAGDWEHDRMARLQELCADPGTGSWLSAMVIAESKPDGGYGRRGIFNYEHEIDQFNAEGAHFTAQDLIQTLERFPRRGDLIYPWMRQRIEAAGLDVPEAK